MTSDGSAFERAVSVPSTFPPATPISNIPESGTRVVRDEHSAAGDYRSLLPGLPPLTVPDAKLVALAAALTEERDDEQGDNHAIPAGYTYLAQFVAHDLTHDTTPHLGPQSGSRPPVPRNLRTPALDLDSVYGHGPFWSPQYYARDGRGRFRLGTTRGEHDHHDRVVPSSEHDLPRDKQGFATIPDLRNDGHLILAQLHVAFMRAHNALLAKLSAGDPEPPFQELLERYGLPYVAARAVLQAHYRATVRDELAKLLLDEEVYASLVAGGPRWFRFDAAEPFLPLEFSCAAFRLHTMVRARYDYNAIFPESRLKQLLDFTGLFNGGNLVPIPSTWVIDWRRFFPLDPAITPNPSRKLDAKLTRLLNCGDVSIPGLERGLSERTLLRGSKMGLPSGQAVAQALGFDPLVPAELGTGPDGAVARELELLEATPLWYYLMKEAEQAGGTKLGKVGSTLVGEVLFALVGDESGNESDADPALIQPGMKGLLELAGEPNPIGL